MNLEHSKTLQCLVNAFAGESQARNRYTFFSKVAKEEGYEQISDIFLVTAENEKEHAKLFYKQIPDSKHFQVNGTYPFSYGDTYSNLIAAASGEREEWEILYKQSAQIAKDEGFDEISRLFANADIPKSEKKHHVSVRFATIRKVISNCLLKNFKYKSKPPFPSFETEVLICKSFVIYTYFATYF